MGESSANPKRRWLRGSIFWLLIALSGLIAGSWIKSYWRYDAIDYSGHGHYGIDDDSGRLTVFCIPIFGDQSGLKHKSGPPGVKDTWKYGGFAFEQEAIAGWRSTYLLVPHWFPLLLCLSAAWWTSRPWRKQRKDQRLRGFEVLNTTPPPGPKQSEI